MRHYPRSSCSIALLVFVWGCQKPNPAFDDQGESGETRGQDTLAGDGDGDGDPDTGDGDGDGDPDAGDGDGDSNTGDGDGDGDPDAGDGDGDGDTQGDGDGDGDGDPNQCNPGQMLCDGMCVDTDFDDGNCGECGMMCTDNQHCGFGICKHRRLIFVTQSKYSGNFGGVEVGNQICNETAMDAGLAIGDYRAWLSDAEKSPSNTFGMADGVYVLPKGDVVAYSWADLTDGTLEHPINQSQGGEAVSPSPACITVDYAVWTATTANGAEQQPSCNGWSSDNAFVLGQVGDAQSMVNTWSATNCTAPCGTLLPIYCVQL